MAKKLDFLPEQPAGVEEGPDPTLILSKGEAKALNPGQVPNSSQEVDPTVILPRQQVRQQQPQQRQGAPVAQQQGNFWEVDWAVAAQVLYTQGNTLKGMDNDAAKVSAGVILAIADALVVGIRSAATKRGAKC